MRTSLALAPAIVLLLARAANAQSADPLPSTTDCAFAVNDPCIERFHSTVRDRDRQRANDAYVRGMRAFAGLGIAFGAPQLFGGIYAATLAQPRTHNVGYAAAWIANGTILTLAGTVLAIVPMSQPTRAPEGGSTWIATGLFGLAALGHGAWAAAAWIAPPQDVDATVNHVFAASMVANALWYGAVAALSRADLRADRALARVSPYASLDPRAASLGLSGRF